MADIIKRIDGQLSVVRIDGAFSIDEKSILSEFQGIQVEMHCWSKGAIGALEMILPKLDAISVEAEGRIPIAVWEQLGHLKCLILRDGVNVLGYSFEHFTGLQKLVIETNLFSFKDVYGAQIYGVKLCETAVGNVQNLDALPHLVYLNLESIKSKNIPKSIPWSRLKYFSINNYRGSYFTLPRTLDELETFIICRSKVTGVENFPFLPKLRMLNISNWQPLPNLDSLAICTMLESVCLDSCGSVTGLNTLAEHSKMIELALCGGTEFSENDISWISNMKNLKRIGYYDLARYSLPFSEIVAEIGLPSSGIVSGFLDMKMTKWADWM